MGSCYGPFCDLPRLRVTALDLWPAVPGVLRADFLSVALSDRTEVDRAAGRLLSLAAGAWHAVLFCLLLEYLPTARLRYECCRRAAALLRTEGVLLVASPDSAHRTANGPLYRAWRLALATLGLVRVRCAPDRRVVGGGWIRWRGWICQMEKLSWNSEVKFVTWAVIALV